MILSKEKYGKVIQLTNFNMPFYWNEEKRFYTRTDRVTGEKTKKLTSKWSESEALLVDIEKESMWRDYFAAKGDNKQSGKSYYRAQALKQRLLLVEEKEKERFNIALLAMKERLDNTIYKEKFHK